jgi:hypothetical protein
MEVGLGSILDALPYLFGKCIPTACYSNFFLKFCLSHIHHSKLVFSAQGIENYVLLSWLVSDVHIEQGQCVLPPYLF